MQKPLIPTRYLMVLGTFLLAMLVLVDRACISVAKEPITQALQLSDKQFGWVMSVFALGYALFQAPAGYLADTFGARRILTAVVLIWSAFTIFTGLVSSFLSLLIVRFLFGMGEAGAFPGISKMVSKWIPINERGTVIGINFSGGRVGTALALPYIGLLVQNYGWQNMFFIMGGIGILWASIWFISFRDEPTQHPLMSNFEKDLILKNTSKNVIENNTSLTINQILKSRNVWYVMAQYFASNFTFFFCLSWLVPHIKEHFSLTTTEAGFYSSIPIICGALGNIFSGYIVDFIYKKGNFRWSRNIAAIIGFSLAAAGLLLSQTTENLSLYIFYLSIAVFGADMTLSPSWTFCADIAKKSTALVSGTMNMAGNLGSFVTSLAFPYLKDWTGSVIPFFYVAAFFNILAIYLWIKMNPEKAISS
jgi:MFS transporter, ACS family, glucarate transporter